MKSAFVMVAMGAATLGLAACGEKERSAEVDTGVAEVEVTTKLPEEALPDEELKRAATQAAADASSAPAAVVVAPAPGSAPAGTAATGTTTPPAQ